MDKTDKALETLKTTLAIFGVSALMANIIHLPDKEKKHVQELLESGDIEGVKKITGHKHEDDDERYYDRSKRKHERQDEDEYRRDEKPYHREKESGRREHRKYEDD